MKILLLRFIQSSIYLVKFIKDFKRKLFTEITTIPEIVEGSYFPSLDGLRALAIMMVILYHFGANHFLRPFHLLINGDTGVNIFFVISGFLITTLLLKEKVKSRQISLRRFYLRRMLRIVPAAYLFLLVIIILNAIYKYRVTDGAFMASFLFYKNFPYHEEPFTGHFWSLAAEVQFYLIFPYLLSVSINKYTLIILSIVIAVPVISVFGYYRIAFFNDNSIARLIIQVIMYSFWKGPFIILIGSLAAVFLFKGIIRIGKAKGNSYLSLLLLIVAIVISSKSFLYYTKYVSEYFSAILFAGIILLNLGDNNFLSVILKNKVLVKIGVLSYSLYLWQQPFLGNHVWQPWLSAFRGYSQGALILVKLIIVFTIAFVSYYFVELKFMGIKSKYK